MTISISETPQDLFDLCREIESGCAELYHFYAELFQEDKEVMLLWKRMALEEENHSREFDLAAKLMRQKAISSFKIELINAEIALIYIRSHLNRMKENPPTIEDALKDAIELEDKMSVFHLECVAEFSAPSFECLFRAIIQADQDHLASLRNAYEEVKRDVVI